MRFSYKLLLVVFALVPMALSAQHKEVEYTLPTWNIKTNLIADATTSPSLALEFRTGGHSSIDLYGSFNPWTFNGGTTIKHWLVQPELRFWVKETFRGSFFGLHGHYAQYDINRLWNPPFSKHMRNNRYEGDLYGAGVSWGYRWNFSQVWGLEFTIGAGYARVNYDRWECETCGKKLGSGHENYFGPTKLGLNLIVGIGGKKIETVYVPEPTVVVVEPYAPRLVADFITPEADPVKVRQESGKAYLEYEVGKSTVLPTFRNNAGELARINELVGRIKADSDATITGITLTGHASPEGTASSNQSLSQRRADALKAYVAKTDDVSADIMTARGAGEDWTTLEQLVNSSSVADKTAVLDAVRSGGDLDAREAKLRAIAGGAPYNTIKADMYPKLRRTDYVLDYTVAPISVERGKEILHTNPGNLSLNELFRIADTYEPGSREYREVQEIAANTYPDSDVANINAGAAALQHGDSAAAERFLSKVKDHSAPVYLNNMGVLSWLLGERTKAEDFFRRAGSAGATNMSELEKHLDSIE